MRGAFDKPLARCASSFRLSIAFVVFLLGVATRFAIGGSVRGRARTRNVKHEWKTLPSIDHDFGVYSVVRHFPRRRFPDSDPRSHATQSAPCLLFTAELLEKYSGKVVEPAGAASSMFGSDSNALFDVIEKNKKRAAEAEAAAAAALGGGDADGDGEEEEGEEGGREGEASISGDEA